MCIRLRMSKHLSKIHNPISIGRHMNSNTSHRVLPILLPAIRVQRTRHTYQMKHTQSDRQEMQNGFVLQ